MEPTDLRPSEFFAALSEADRPAMRTLDRLIRDELPRIRRTVWQGVFWGGTEQSILGYGRIVQPRPRGRSVEWFLVGLARQKRHISVYVNATIDGRYVGQACADALGRAKVGASSISFATLDHVDLEGLRTVLRLAREQTSG